MRAALLLLPLLMACPKPEPEPEPGPLMAGVARVRMPVPLGIGTVGYGGFGGGGGGSPYAQIYPATQRIHGHPEFKAVAISRGEGFELVFLRSDTVGIFQQFRRAVVLELEDRLGRPMDDVLVMGGTHTHSGPGRVIDGGGLYDLIADRFFPEFYANMVDAAADAVELAIADLAPARVGHAWADAPDGHNDRRCEDGDHKNDATPLLAIEREGQIDALVFAYAVHGTVLGIDDLTLSQDVSGAIEQQIEDGFDHPVHALFFNAWGADMAPSAPDFPSLGGAELPSGYERMEATGRVVADAVHAAVPDLAWTETPAIEGALHRVPINREAIGYAPGEFDYEFGGVYCTVRGLGEECDGTVGTEIGACVPFPEDYPAPMQTELSAGRVGDLWWVTFPGEPGTLLAEDLLTRLEAEHGTSEVMFLGYTQDYLGYSILEDDWWLGGYEASGALWGPRQGEYLRDRAADAFAQVASETPPELPEGPGPVTPFATDGFTPWQPTPELRGGEIEVDVLPNYGASDLITFTVRGADPWMGAPLAALETADGAPVLRANGVPVDSDDYTMWVDLVVEPAWSEEATERAFHWTFTFPARRDVPGGVELDGTYRLRVSVPLADGSVAEVVSSNFQVASE